MGSYQFIEYKKLSANLNETITHYLRCSRIPSINDVKGERGEQIRLLSTLIKLVNTSLIADNEKSIILTAAYHYIMENIRSTQINNGRSMFQGIQSNLYSSLELNLDLKNQMPLDKATISHMYRALSDFALKSNEPSLSGLIKLHPWYKFLQTRFQFTERESVLVPYHSKKEWNSFLYYILVSPLLHDEFLVPSELFLHIHSYLVEPKTQPVINKVFCHLQDQLHNNKCNKINKIQPQMYNHKYDRTYSEAIRFDSQRQCQTSKERYFKIFSIVTPKVELVDTKKKNMVDPTMHVALSSWFKK